MLKIFGLYVPTMAAVADRNFGYLALFAAGAACRFSSNQLSPLTNRPSPTAAPAANSAR